MTYIHLLKQIKACNICKKYLPLGPRPVLQFNPKARILIAGQAPGKKVHETGIPFDDPSGDRLRAWMGIDKDAFYNPEYIAILPMGFCYPGTGKSGDLAPRPECAVTWREELIARLPNLSLTLVIGQYAHQWHLQGRQKENLTQTVKAWKEYGKNVLPLPHPSPRNNIWLKKNPWFEKNLLPELKKRISEIKSN